MQETFKISKIGTIAGTLVTEGTVTRQASVRLLRDNIVIHTGKVSSLKRHKDDASEVRAGTECGIGIVDFNDVKPGDVIEFFIMEKYRDNVRAASAALEKQNPDGERHPNGYKQLEMHVQKGLRQVDEILLIAPPEYKPPLQLVRTDLVTLDDELLRLLFPRKHENKPPAPAVPLPDTQIPEPSPSRPIGPPLPLTISASRAVVPVGDTRVIRVTGAARAPGVMVSPADVVATALAPGTARGTCALGWSTCAKAGLTPWPASVSFHRSQA